MTIYYLVNNKKYFDNYMLREKLQLSKSTLQCLMKDYSFRENQIIKVQNKKLYSVDGVTDFLKKITERHG
jgi:hypothetical protein